jgi:hypothetical protein
MAESVVIAAQVPSGARPDEMRAEIVFISLDQRTRQVKGELRLSLQHSLTSQVAYLTRAEDSLRRSLRCYEDKRSGDQAKATGRACHY